MADANQAVPPVIVQNNALRIPTNITLPIRLSQIYRFFLISRL